VAFVTPEILQIVVCVVSLFLVPGLVRKVLFVDLPVGVRREA
jgi:hypothetical protein